MGTVDSGTPSTETAPRHLADRQLTVRCTLMDTMEDLSRRLTSQLQKVGLSSGDYLVMLALSEATGHGLRASELVTHSSKEVHIAAA